MKQSVYGRCSAGCARLRATESSVPRRNSISAHARRMENSSRDEQDNDASDCAHASSNHRFIETPAYVLQLRYANFSCRFRPSTLYLLRGCENISFSLWWGRSARWPRRPRSGSSRQVVILPWTAPRSGGMRRFSMDKKWRRPTRLPTSRCVTECVVQLGGSSKADVSERRMILL